MYAKVFTQILDSSIAEDHEVRHMFEDLLKLCDLNGVVDMTRESIARRLNVPLEIVTRCIGELEKPDLTSRTPDHEGRRIVRIDDHREWGWFIVNHGYYRGLASEEQRREKTKARTQKWRKHKDKPSCDASVTHGDASDAMQKQRHIAESEEGGSGHPTWEQAQRWLANWRKNGADYTEFEARGAFLSLQAGGWMWGKNAVADPRAALESRIQSERQKAANSPAAAIREKDQPINHVVVSAQKRAAKLRMEENQ